MYNLYFLCIYIISLPSTTMLLLDIGLLHELHTKKIIMHAIQYKNVVCEKVLSDPGPALASRYSSLFMFIYDLTTYYFLLPGLVGPM